MEPEREIDNRCDRLIGDLPEDYRLAAPLALELKHTFFKKLALAVEPRLNHFVDQQPQATLQEKQRLATWVNAELRKLGLTIRCPVTRQAATLIADFKNAQESHISRFRIQSQDENGKRVRSSLSLTVPYLELMEDPPRREALARRHSRGE